MKKNMNREEKNKNSNCLKKKNEIFQSILTAKRKIFFYFI